jgi:hypothetical protein
VRTSPCGDHVIGSHHLIVLVLEDVAMPDVAPNKAFKSDHDSRDHSGIVKSTRARPSFNRTGMRKTDVAYPFSNEDILASGYLFSPVLGFRKSTPLLLNRRKLNICVSEFAMVSKDPWPMRTPPSQLSSMKRMTELWSVTV